MQLKKSDTFDFVIDWDSDIEFKTRIIKWSTIALKTWVVQSKNKKACDLLLNASSYVKINKRWKQFWGSITHLPRKENKYFDFLAEYDKDMYKLDDLQFYFIISHEIGHCIDYALRGESWHDKQWGEICQIIGAQPSTEIEVKRLDIIKRDFPEVYKIAQSIVKNNS
jgi:hypothetical protein